MPNKYSNLRGNEKIKDSFGKINDGFAAVEEDITMARTETIGASRIANNSIPASKLKQDTNADKIQPANLSAEVISMMNGQSPTGTTPTDGSVTTEKIATGAVTREKLETTLDELIHETFDEATYSNQYVYAIIDSANNIAFAIRPDGQIVAKVNSDIVGNSSTVSGPTLTAALDTLKELIDSLGSGSVANTSDVEGATVTDALNELKSGAHQEMLPEEAEEYAYVIIDSKNNIAFGIKSDGTLVAKFSVDNIPDASITKAKLSAEVSDSVAEHLSEESGFVYSIVDTADKIAFGIKTNGKSYFNLDPASIPDGSVTEEKLAEEVSTQLMDINNGNDVAPVEPDELRFKYGEIAVTTESSGHGWAKFPRLLTPVIKGFNKTGTSIEARRRSGLVLRGRHYRGTYNPIDGNPGSINRRGDIGETTSFPPSSGTFAVGDYYRMTWYLARTFTVDGQQYTMNAGDNFVWNGTTWVVQRRPDINVPGGWFIVTHQGYYGGTEYKVNDKMMYLARQTNGGPVYHHYHVMDAVKGENSLRGEWNPADGLPSAPLEGDVWIASAAGTAGGITFAKDDMLVYESAAWGKMPTEPIRTFANNEYMFLPCIRNADEWEVRRADKLATRVTLKLRAYSQRGRPRSSRNKAMWGDSMTAGIASHVISQFPGQTVQVNGYGGATSSNILSMMHREILKGGDRYRGWTHILWFGQNNGNDETMYCVPKALEIIGSLNAERVVLMSVLGQRVCTWDGSRIKVPQHEDQLNKVAGSRYDLVSFYQNTYPESLFYTREYACAGASDDIPALDFPGMTEKQVADTYGIVPLSFFLTMTNKPWQPQDLNFVGYRSTSGLPTGGNPNDYYVRNGGGTIGAIIVNVEGTWTEYTYDQTHINDSGEAVLAEALKNFIDAKGW